MVSTTSRGALQRRRRRRSVIARLPNRCPGARDCRAPRGPSPFFSPGTTFRCSRASCADAPARSRRS
jgi:hypothetical protein